MGKVLHTKGTSGSGSGVYTLWKYTATNYADLLTKTGMAEGDLAIVYNSQGVWLVNRKLKGVYMYQSGVWEYANQELQDMLEQTEYKAKVSPTDTTGNYLFNKFIDSTDVFRLISNFGFDEGVSILLNEKNKVWTSSINPTVNDDNTVLNRHRIGQVWVNTTTNDSFICKSISVGAAVWTKTPNTDSLGTKSGQILNVAFAGNPKKATVTFTTPFANTLYSVALGCETQNDKSYLLTYESKTVNGFVINANANNINDLISGNWCATIIGEN